MLKKFAFILVPAMNSCYFIFRFLQIVCSFLVRDMGIDWRMGAEWFETCLLDYDPCSNYGNWTYGAGLTSVLNLKSLVVTCLDHPFHLKSTLAAGVGNDPREDRYFSIPKQVSPPTFCVTRDIGDG